MIKYKDCFEGLGKLKDVKLKVHTKDSVTPVAQKARRLPFLMKQQVDKEIDYLLELKVIEPAEEVFKCLREKNLTVNPNKCKFLKSELLLMDHKLSASRNDPDKRKVKSIHELSPPSNQKELRSFLGMITYCSKFLPNFATITEPLRRLLKNDTTWEWTSEHEKTSNASKKYFFLLIH